MTTADVSSDYYEFWGIDSSVFRKPYQGPEDFHKDKVLDLFIRRLSLSLLNYPACLWVYGPSGIGKSTLGLYLYQTLSVVRYEVYFTDVAADRSSLSMQIEDHFGLKLDQKDCFKELKSEDRRLVIILDNVDAMRNQDLEELHHLFMSQGSMISFVALSSHKARQNSKIDQLLTSNFELPFFDTDRLSRLIKHFLSRSQLTTKIMDTRALELIQRSTGGNPKHALLLAEQCLIESYLEGSHEVTADIVKSALAFTIKDLKVMPPSSAELPDALTTTRQPHETILPPLEELLEADARSHQRKNELPQLPIKPTPSDSKKKHSTHNHLSLPSEPFKSEYDLVSPGDHDISKEDSRGQTQQDFAEEDPTESNIKLNSLFSKHRAKKSG